MRHLVRAASVDVQESHALTELRIGFKPMGRLFRRSDSV